MTVILFDGNPFSAVFLVLFIPRQPNSQRLAHCLPTFDVSTRFLKIL
jgi:hypothetical protein